MLNISETFSSFSVDDSRKASAFYRDVLGLQINTAEGMEKYGVLELHIPGANSVIIYPKPDHQPATFTVLNFPVDDIDAAVEELSAKGVQFEHYDDETYNMDEKHIARSTGPEPDIAWFKDPAGNILSVLQE